jgi:GT2 family glycosyltransferase
VPPLVSIITINYNQPKITCEFLRSLRKLSYTNFEVIVIDNASSEDPTQQITSEFPSVRFYRTTKNLGFSGGNNVAMKLALGDYFFIVNNDTEIADVNLLEKLIEPFEKNPLVGMASPKIRYFDFPETIQFAGYHKINSFTGRNSQVGDREIDKGQYDKSGLTNYANGAAMMVKREVTQKVGVFTDHFFLMYEELDWSAQTIKYGYQIFYQAEVYLLHKESMSVGKTSPLKVYYNNRNRIMFMRRNTNFIEFACFLFYLVFLTIPKNVFTFLVKRQFEHLKAFAQAMIWNIQNINIYKRVPFHTMLEHVSLDTIKKQ